MAPILTESKRRIIKFFQKHNLKITIEATIIQTDFLDVTLNLKTEKHWPFRKPNDQQLYININSNHPPSIKKALPNMISNRLSELSCNLDNFKKAIPQYKNAIKQSGYNNNLIFSETQPKKKSRKRKIIWFNPPFNNYVANNIGKEFLKLINKHFPPQHKLHKILNRNSIKISYSCMPKKKANITGHNKKLLEKESSQQSKPCKNKGIFPLKGSCRQQSVNYQADIYLMKIQQKAT